MKQIALILCLSLCLLLAACGDTDTSGAADTSGGANAFEATAGSSAPRGETKEEAAGFAAMAAGAVEGQFQPLEPVVLQEEYNGYSCTVTVETWVGGQGAGAPMIHPWDGRFVMPAHKNTESVIPFAITVETTTQNADFATDISLNLMGWRELETLSGSGRTYLCPSNDLERRMETVEQQRKYYREQKPDEPPEQVADELAKSIFQANGSHQVIFVETAAGAQNYMVGYLAVEDYFSPAHPDGNTELLKLVELQLQLQLDTRSIRIHNAQYQECHIALRPSAAYEPPPQDWHVTEENPIEYIVLSAR